ncbi:DinB family protein [Evansella tamaricis]|uniref:DinB family protein n=1 Tax=Evansella tamaricis TaxID=2069301 RepID=A0ABS6J9K8_9BACI|nr:DinB family protein [Evansella tamaricis]MBU9710216.1 DinB family protein [Evansella tamaricis]
MNFKLEEAIEVLERTPQALEFFLSGLSVEWLLCNEGAETWNASEVIDHLIECEKVNWMPRLEVFFRDVHKDGGADSRDRAEVEGRKDKEFPPFDRFAHLNHSTEGSIEIRLLEFKTLRTQNLIKLKELVNPVFDLELTAVHPVLGEVKLRELLSTWVVHDLTHISQIVRVMAERYREDVGPWIENLSVLDGKG